MELDTIIVGAGPAGLSAALVLGRCRRRVLMIDAGNPRNAASRHLHNFITREGMDPAKFRALAREELAMYQVELLHTTVTSAARTERGFTIRTAEGRDIEAPTLLLATGVTDQLPSIENLHAFYGQGVHHCPYCDAHAYINAPMASYGEARAALGLALNLQTWSRDITLLLDGGPLDTRTRREAALFNIAIRPEKIGCLMSSRGKVQPSEEDRLGRVVFESGPDLLVQAVFFNTGQVQRSTLPQQLGCRMNSEGGVLHDNRQRTGIPGLYLAGDASRDVQFVVVAAAEGAKAATAINRDLQDREHEAIRRASLRPRGSRSARPKSSGEAPLPSVPPATT